jgi:hypothetical protein
MTQANLRFSRWGLGAPRFSLSEKRAIVPFLLSKNGNVSECPPLITVAFRIQATVSVIIAVSTV